ncbi:MAG: PD40 domain-containing protein [Gemmatimonadaceae bacterium]|nr:PD40 domain-containing protein [Gemmatimonadaceae bacterium]
MTALVAIPLHDAGAQYFGRNKVQYDKLDFRILPTDHFRIHFYPAESLATADVARLAERWYARHKALLHHEFSGNPLIFYSDPPDFQQSNVIEGEISQGTGGVTEGLRERVIMPFTGSYAETDHVLGHELVHVFQYRIAAESKGGLRSVANIPLWLIEGMAEYLSLGRVDPNTAMWLRDALRRNDLPTLTQLTRDPRYFPYRYGQALWAYIGARFGDDAVNRVFRAALEQGWEKGVATSLGVSTDSLSRQWHDAIRAAYGPAVRERTAPDRVGRAVALAGGRGEQNISPAVSPDGRYVAYFSSRGLFGMDLYLAEVETGRVLQQLTSVTTNAHFDQLSFLSSAGTWSPDGAKLAFVVYAQGDNEIDVMDVASRRIEKRIRVRGVGAMADPAWSPDGRQLAFTGYKGGLSDLYLHDLANGQTRQLTNDREAQLQPSWNPDGRSLAFVTDAGPETDFAQMRFGETRLAIMDVAAARIQLLPRFGTGKHVNPRYTPDGTALLFVSDQDGVSDLYRLNLASGEVRRVTRIATGVSGITALSPALSVARNGTVLLSVFDQQGYSIRALAAAETLGEPVTAESQRTAGILPPVQGRAALVDESLEQVTDGLPLRAPTATVPYKSSLRLDYIGGPQLGIGVGGGYGTGVSGGVALSFSDELGNRNVQAVLQAQGDVKDLGGQVLYLNRENRWNWGGQAYHIPMAGGFATYDDATFNIDGQDVPGTIYRQEIQRVFYDNAQAIAQYPLSATRRFEFSLGAQRIGFDRQVDSLYIVGDQVLREVRGSAPAGQALTFGTATAAFVGDYSFFGFTSPVAGGRYRFELSPSVGTINYATALADFRRYFLARPVTLAFRGMHFGRYGAGAESDRMQPLFVGQPYLIRGYDPSSFDASECIGGSPANDCPAFNRLAGSRIGVANVELRIPLFGTRQFGLINLPFLPTEVSPFVDAGYAWNKGDKLDFRFDRSTSDRVPVFSAGFSVRANLLGYAIGEFYWAHPFQRPEKNWVFGFQLQPGW